MVPPPSRSLQEGIWPAPTQSAGVFAGSQKTVATAAVTLKRSRAVRKVSISTRTYTYVRTNIHAHMHAYANTYTDPYAHTCATSHAHQHACNGRGSRQTWHELHSRRRSHVPQPLLVIRFALGGRRLVCDERLHVACRFARPSSKPPHRRRAERCPETQPKGGCRGWIGS
jgi:hypothetical protein